MPESTIRPEALTLNDLCAKRTPGYVSLPDPRDCIHWAELNAGTVLYTLEQVRETIAEVLDARDNRLGWDLTNALRFWFDFIGDRNVGLVEEQVALWDNLEKWFAPALKHARKPTQPEEGARS